MTEDPYLDAATGILRNRLGIHTEHGLREAEAGLTIAAVADLGVRLLPGHYDLEHLCDFHREIFGDLYDWAGCIRTVNIAKIDPFCIHQHIQTYSEHVFTALRKEGHLLGLPLPLFLDRLTHYYAEVNAIHPFREGNGRTQRAFFYQLCRVAGWPVDWSDMDGDENVEASVASLRGDNEPLRRMLERLVRA